MERLLKERKLSATRYHGAQMFRWKPKRGFFIRFLKVLLTLYGSGMGVVGQRDAQSRL